MSWPIRIRDDIKEALDGHRPVVALESTIFVHGLPRPINLQVAAEIERIVGAEGAIPATVGAVAGSIIVGLTYGEIERLSTAPDVPKASIRDLAVLLARGGDGATTVASTAKIAALAGIAVFSTGGLGGIHRGARDSWDESADLIALGRTPITVVSAGVKSILDVGATLERLETLSVPVVGFRTLQFPGFYLTDSGHTVDWSVETAEEIAQIMRAQRALGERSALLVANPIPVEEQLDPALHHRILRESLDEARRRGIEGKAVTPFLLDYFHHKTEDQSLRVNTRIVYNNARLAANVARAWCAIPATVT